MLGFFFVSFGYVSWYIFFLELFLFFQLYFYIWICHFWLYRLHFSFQILFFWLYIRFWLHHVRFFDIFLWLILFNKIFDHKNSQIIKIKIKIKINSTYNLIWNILNVMLRKSKCWYSLFFVKQTQKFLLCAKQLFFLRQMLHKTH